MSRCPSTDEREAKAVFGARTARPPDSRPFEVNGHMPVAFLVREVTPEGHATRLYAVVAEYPWTQSILAGDCYRDVANDIARVLGAHLGVPYTQAGDPQEERR